jgi:hypothetical protein
MSYLYYIDCACCSVSPESRSHDKMSNNDSAVVPDDHAIEQGALVVHYSESVLTVSGLVDVASANAQWQALLVALRNVVIHIVDTSNVKEQGRSILVLDSNAYSH